MATFPATHFKFATEYPESGQRMQLGNSYQFDVLPEAPDQRIFTLTLRGMAYFTDANDVISTLLSPWRNMKVLEDFYNTHKRAKVFDLAHPVYGTVKCKFAEPLTIPSGIDGGSGVLEDFEVKLIEIP